MFVELIGGYYAGSLAIMTDAAHLLSDLSGFVIQAYSMTLVLKEPDDKYTYGYLRYEIVGSLISILIIWILTAQLLYEAVFRFIKPDPINSTFMLGLALSGVIFNLTLAYILLKNSDIQNKFEHEENEEEEI